MPVLGSLINTARNVYNVARTPQVQNVVQRVQQRLPSVQGAQAPGPYVAPPTGGGIGQAPMAQPPGQEFLRDDINRQVDDLGAIIDRDYEVAMGSFAAQEQDIRGQAAASEQGIRAGYAPARTAIGEEQATRETGLKKEEQTATTQSASAMQQARDLFRQMQQQNIAQLSGLGISSSSVSEALAERLGVETARRLAGITGSNQEIMQNIAQERTRVQTFYQQKVADLEQDMAARIAGVQQSLMEGINQINRARQTAAADKSNRRAELLSRAQSEIAQLNAQAAKFAQELQMWNQRRQSSLEDAQQFVVTPTDFSALTNAAQSVQGLAGLGLNLTPEFSINPGGRVSTTLRGRDEEEELANPFR